MVLPASPISTVLQCFPLRIPHCEGCVTVVRLASVLSLSPSISVIIGRISPGNSISGVEMPLTPAVVCCWFVLPVTAADDWKMCNRTRHSKNSPDTLSGPMGECKLKPNLSFSTECYGSVLMKMSKITWRSAVGVGTDRTILWYWWMIFKILMNTFSVLCFTRAPCKTSRGFHALCRHT